MGRRRAKMDSFVAINKGNKITVSLDDKAVIECYPNRINAIARFTARKEELKKLGYHIQHVGVETIQGRRIEKSESVQRLRKVKFMGRYVNE